jgi:phenylpropionate dioxygenase-like ring-hydroxylating dioxygenase large terminal subunit
MIVPNLDLSRLRGVPFPVATVKDLRRRGWRKAQGMGLDLVVVWNQGAPRTYVDACPHMGLPLTMGRLEGDRLRCRYHGWAFDTDLGQVKDQPTLHRPQPCAMRRLGTLVAGDLVFAWTGEDDTASVRARLPEDVVEGASVFRVVYETPFYLALYSSVDYAHFRYHTGFGPLYGLYSLLRKNAHQPGSPFAPRVVAEHEHRLDIEIPEADRRVRLWITAAEMWDGAMNRFQTFVAPLSPDSTLYWECYRPQGGVVQTLAARAAFRVATTRFLAWEDASWTRAASPHFLRGGNIHLSANDVALGAHLRKWVLPRSDAEQR